MHMARICQATFNTAHRCRATERWPQIPEDRRLQSMTRTMRQNCATENIQPTHRMMKLASRRSHGDAVKRPYVLHDASHTVAMRNSRRTNHATTNLPAYMAWATRRPRKCTTHEQRGDQLDGRDRTDELAGVHGARDTEAERMHDTWRNAVTNLSVTITSVTKMGITAARRRETSIPTIWYW